MSIIEVKNLTKKFGEMIAVNSISFSVNKGEFFAFLGPNGAGKTTTIKMLTTILKPDNGEIVLNGEKLSVNPRAARRSFGIVFQDQSLDDELTAYENLEFHGVLYGVPRSDLRPSIEKLLELVELGDRRDDLVKKFSGGMKRRLEIARSVLHRPSLIFLDEPTVGLDPQTRNRLWDYLRQLQKEAGTTVFFTTHYMEEAERMSDRVAIIDHGNILKHDTAENIKKETGSVTLEEAFLKLTGKKIRDEDASSQDNMRAHRKMWVGKK